MKMKKPNTESPQTFLDTSGTARKVTVFGKDEQIYSQGDSAKSVMYIQRGNVKSSVVSSSGKVAVIAILGPNDFLGEGCLGGSRSARAPPPPSHRPPCFPSTSTSCYTCSVHKTSFQTVLSGISSVTTTGSRRV